MTSIIMLFIKFVLRIPLRMSEENLLIGDDAIHGEDAYAFGDVSASHQVNHSVSNRDTEMGLIQANDSDDEPK